MTLGVGLLAAVLVLVGGLGVRPEKRARALFAALATPFAWAALFGTLRAFAWLTQRDLPEPCFTSPPGWLGVAAAPLAVAAGLLLAGRARILRLVLAETGILLAALALNYHASFPPYGIFLRPLCGFTERVYRYDEVRAVKFVTHARAGAELVHRPRYVVELEDGTCWTTLDGLPREAVPRFDQDAIELISQRSDRILQQVQTDDRP